MIKKTKLPPGKYYIGDPCYIFSESWSDVLHTTDFFQKEPCLIKDKLVFGGSTAHGDGVYSDNTGNSYWVDAGMLAVIPISLLKMDNKYNVKSIQQSEGMHIVEFMEDFDCSLDAGVFDFGHIHIDTDGSETEDEDY